MNPSDPRKHKHLEEEIFKHIDQEHTDQEHSITGGKRRVGRKVDHITAAASSKKLQQELIQEELELGPKQLKLAINKPEESVLSVTLLNVLASREREAKKKRNQIASCRLENHRRIVQ